MINYNNCQFESSIAGLFYTDKEWIHPTTSIETYEIILVVNGTIYIEEDNEKYTLKRNHMLMLDPMKTHGGFAASTGITTFYWIHFYASDIAKLPPIPKLITNFDEIHIFKEYLHFNNLPNYPADFLDISLLNLLARISQHKKISTNSTSSKLANEVYEYIKLNSSPTLSMKQIANHFGVTHEHLSRLVSKHFGIGIKKLNNDILITSINTMLANTNYSMKEIAAIHEFADTNTFLKFYKYHTEMTPKQYKNMYSLIHMNNK